MGVAGHQLGPRRVAWLSRKTELDIAAAFRFCSTEYLVFVRTDECRHYDVNAKTFEVSEPRACSKSYASCARFAATRC